MRQILILLLISLSLLAGCSSEEAVVEIEPERIAVETMTAEYGSLIVSKTYSGTVKGIEHAEILAKLAESVEKIMVSEGDLVKKGDLLLTLNEGGPSSQYRQARAVYQNAKKLRTKYRNLFKEGAVSENDLDAINTEFKVAEANYKGARELVEIISPINGKVTSLNVNIGEQVYQGQHLATISQTDEVRVAIGVDPADIDYLQAGDTVTLWMQGADIKKVTGTISRVAGSADPMTRAFEVEIIAPNNEVVLKVGAFATTKLKLYSLDQVLVLPRDAILIQKGLPKLFKLNGDTAKSVEVQLGQTDGTLVEIKSGLKLGEEIVVLGQSFLSDGVLVNVVNAGGGELSDISGYIN